MPDDKNIFPYPGWNPEPSEEELMMERWARPVPYSLPEFYDDGSIADVSNISRGIKEGWGGLYKRDIAKGAKFYQDKDGEIYRIADNANVRTDGLRELKYEDIRKMLPGKDYIGGSKWDVRVEAMRRMPKVAQKVYERAKTYGIDPNMMIHRLMEEGWVDQQVINYNGSDAGAQRDYWDSIWEGPVSGYGSFGLDYAGDNLMAGKYELLDENARWTDLGTWEDNEGSTGYRSGQHQVEAENLASAIEMMAAEMKYKQDLVRQRYEPSTEDLGKYVNAAYHRGVHGRGMDNPNFVRKEYSYPDYYGEYGFEKGYGGDLNGGTQKVLALAKKLWEKGYGVEYGEGGKIHIKPENRGKFTALKERTGHSATWFKENGTPAQKKMAVFALNARKWNHAEGGDLENGEDKLWWNLGDPYQVAVPEPEQQVVEQPVSEKVSAIVNKYPLSMLKARRAALEQQISGLEPVPSVSSVQQQPVIIPEGDITVPFETKAAVDKVKGKRDSEIIREAVGQYKNGEELKEFQKQLLAEGYYKNLPVPKITARTKDEIMQFQSMLKGAGYDLGTYGENKDGVDGKIGAKTRKAWEQYVKDHPDEALVNAVADGKMGAQTRAAAEAYFKDKMTQLDPEVLGAIEKDTGLAVQMMNGISKYERAKNMAFTAIPAHVGALANKVQNAITGRLNGIDDYDAKLADDIEEAEQELARARKSRNIEAIEEAQSMLDSLKARVPQNVLNRKGLSTAEKKAAAAVITYINGDKQMTYEDYLNNIAIAGKEDGSWLGTNSRHKHAKTGKDVLLYGGVGGYDLMNAAEDARGGIQRVTENANKIQSLIDAESRIYHDPNRGRLGGFSYYIDKDGNIHIKDKLSAPEAKAQRGKNDNEQYNTARDFFPRSSTSDIEDVITLDEYLKYIDEAKSKNNQ